jgi:glyoxylase-like metal-dependent hydrolase (beta-lactamase superfamily II)
MEIAPGVYDLTPPTRGYSKGGYVHAFLVDSADGLILIDTLFDPDAQVILDEIARIGKKAGDLKHILMTHGHRAHLGGLARLKAMSGATVYSHAWEADIIAGDRKQQLPSIFGFRPLETWPIILMGTLLGPLSMHKPCPVDQLLSGGDRVGPLRVVYTPGHTPGHLAFYWAEARVLFSGDAFVTWPSISPGWKNSNLNAKQSWETLRALAEMESAVLGVGHGRPVTQDGSAVMRALAKRGPE